MRRKPSHMPTGRLQSLRLFSTLLAITLKTPSKRLMAGCVSNKPKPLHGSNTSTLMVLQCAVTSQPLPLISEHTRFNATV